MFLRKISEEIAYASSPQDAFDDVRDALQRIGKVKSADEATFTVKGTVPVGGWVTVQVTIVPAEGGSRLSVVGKCDDVWGVGARRGIAALLKALPDPNRPLETPLPLPSIVKKTPSFEDGLTLAQKISVGLFFALTSLGSLDVAWGQGLFPLSLPWLFVLAAAGGAFTSLMIVKRRYWLAGLIAGVVTGLGGVGFSVLLFSQMTSVYKLVAVMTTLLGCLPGIVLFAGLRELQDWLFPLRKQAN